MEKIKIGNKASLIKKITEQDVKDFARLSGDFNLLHSDDDFARKWVFKKKIVHGALLISYLSNCITNKLIGNGGVFMNINFDFLKPVYIEDTITINVKILEIDTVSRIIRLKTEFYNQNNVYIACGLGSVLLPEPHFGDITN